jgi:hypothetical protein
MILCIALIPSYRFHCMRNSSAFSRSPKNTAGGLPTNLLLSTCMGACATGIPAGGLPLGGPPPPPFPPHGGLPGGPPPPPKGLFAGSANARKAMIWVSVIGILVMGLIIGGVLLLQACICMCVVSILMAPSRRLSIITANCTPC